ncbi:MAG: bifunctional phosphopantothenoylcysteine decarboxylase/phosphopantothenate--cysteine ligase CoaBC [Synergistaceae bacterium]|nr:bifunctional phosphopantothenoylcysteine decarboxylase/phosphopantothenate--cysteine ligase CoaBC [Synergistaceae bacterium]
MSNWKTGRRVLLGITGGIAAYKIPALVRLLRKAGCETEIIMTESAKNFVAPMTLETLSGKKVWTDSGFGASIPHIKLTQWAEVFVIAPCTANTLAKTARGIADNLLTSAAVASTCPLLIFPAMNENMYSNKATQENIKILREHGASVIEPSEGALACGVSGKGRMNEPDEISLEIFRALYPIHDMKGKKVLVTAGPTHEYLDPVRFISNPSSGKMGTAMARAAWYRGADVKLIAGPVAVDSYGFDVVHVRSALEMFEAVKENLSWADYIVKAAAVGDYRAKNFAPQKIKRDGKNNLTIELTQNPDIAAEIGKIKRDGQILIGFAAETQDIDENARGKLARKNLDYILANDVTAEGSGFAIDTNTLRLIAKDTSKSEKIFSGPKEDIACEVWENVVSL